MTSEQMNASLTRMIETIESGTLPAPVRALYVLRPAERHKPLLDNLRVVVVHDEPADPGAAALERRIDLAGDTGLHPLLRAMMPFEQQMRRALVPTSEKIEVLLARRVFDIMAQIGRIKHGDLILLWSVSDTDYPPKLEALQADPGAGGGREPIAPLTRVNDSGDTMERVLDMIEKGELTLTRLPLEAFDGRLNPYHSHWLSCWTECRIVDRYSVGLVRYALWWFQQQRQTAAVPHQSEMWSKSRSHRVDYGRPSLVRMLSAFRRTPGLKQQCLILEPRLGDQTQLLVFERGPNWPQSKSAGES